MLLIVICYQSGVSYIYCIVREDHWESASTKKEMERRLFAFYTAKPISPEDSPWGSVHELKPGERMIQYTIFNKEPYDVVYDAKDNVVTTFTSYE